MKRLDRIELTEIARIIGDENKIAVTEAWRSKGSDARVTAFAPTGRATLAKPLSTAALTAANPKGARRSIGTDTCRPMRVSVRPSVRRKKCIGDLDDLEPLMTDRSDTRI
jgi:hypothetical protein